MISNSMVIKAPAKINLFLEVNDKRIDGYHNLSSVMQSISLCDILEVSVSPCKNIVVEVTNYPALSGENNISYKAADLFMEQMGQNYGVEIHIDKKIPILGGLAGGSADAAATLLALNELLHNPFSQQTLLSMGKRLGADVPFCIHQGTALVRGIGDIIEQCEPLPKCYVVIVKAHNKSSTADMFRKLDALKDRRIKSIDYMMRALKEQTVKRIGEEMYNVFSTFDDIDNGVIEKQLYSWGATGVCLSGSGPSIIGLFEFRNDAVIAHENFAKMGIQSYIAEPINNYKMLCGSQF